MLSAVRATRKCPVTVSTVAISSDGSRYLFAGGDPGANCEITVGDTATDKVLFQLRGHRKPVIGARFLKGHHVVSCSFDGCVCWWTPAGELAGTNGIRRDYRSDGFACSETQAWVGDYHGEISRWQRAAPASAMSWQTGSEPLPLWSLAGDAKDKWLVSGGMDGNIRLLDLAAAPVQKTQVELGPGHHIRGLDWGSKLIAAGIAPDGLAPKQSTSRILLLDSRTLKEVRTLETDGCLPYCCRFSPDGTLLAAGGGGTDRSANSSKSNCVIRVWNVKTGVLRNTLTGHTGLVRDLAFSPDSQWLMSAGWDKSVRTWNLQSAD